VDIHPGSVLGSLHGTTKEHSVTDAPPDFILGTSSIPKSGGMATEAGGEAMAVQARRLGDVKVRGPRP